MGGKHYTQEQKDFIRDNIRKPYKEIRKLFEEKFGRSMSEASFDHFVQRYGLRHGKVGYNGSDKEYMALILKKANELIRRPIGHITRYIDKQGVEHVVIKTKHVYGHPGNNCESLVRWAWKKAYGDISKGECIVPVDGNKMNCELSNLRKLTKNQVLQMGRFFKNCKTPESFDTALNICKMRAKIHQEENKPKGKRL